MKSVELPGSRYQDGPVREGRNGSAGTGMLVVDRFENDPTAGQVEILTSEKSTLQPLFRYGVTDLDLRQANPRFMDIAALHADRVPNSDKVLSAVSSCCQIRNNTGTLLTITHDDKPGVLAQKLIPEKLCFLSGLFLCGSETVIDSTRKVKVYDAKRGSIEITSQVESHTDIYRGIALSETNLLAYGNREFHKLDSRDMKLTPVLTIHDQNMYGGYKTATIAGCKAFFAYNWPLPEKPLHVRQLRDSIYDISRSTPYSSIEQLLSWHPAWPQLIVQMSCETLYSVDTRRYHVSEISRRNRTDPHYYMAGFLSGMPVIYSLGVRTSRVSVLV